MLNAANGFGVCAPALADSETVATVQSTSANRLQPVAENRLIGEQKSTWNPFPSEADGANMQMIIGAYCE